MEKMIMVEEEKMKKYNDACLLMKSNDIQLLRSAQGYFEELGDYLDSANKAEECNKKTLVQLTELEKNRKLMRWNIGIICASLVVILMILSLFIGTMIYRNKYYRRFTETDPVPSNIETQLNEE
ncbi:MAG: hypothetical protein E7591_03650 [Ruminococcaceae bacterium]|nr:hypothetical protein [Oscillospiraceae bacterium]